VVYRSTLVGVANRLGRLCGVLPQHYLPATMIRGTLTILIHGQPPLQTMVTLERAAPRAPRSPLPRGPATIQRRAVAPLRPAVPIVPAPPPGLAQVRGIARHIGPTVLTLQVSPLHQIKVYFSTVTPLVARFGRSLFVADIVAGQRLVVIGTRQGSGVLLARQIWDLDVR
jgi:hypothetical protein